MQISGLPVLGVRRPAATTLLAGLLSAAAANAAPGPSFKNDVMQVLSKAGCNMGVCHGNKNGKGGFKLSLRGQDPLHDLLVLSRDAGGRRTDRVDPAHSLILLKPTMAVSHEGGRRFAADSIEYGILRRWIAAGTPADLDDVPDLVDLEVSPRRRVLTEPFDDVRIVATARFDDGSRRDVSRLAVYEVADRLATVNADGVVRAETAGETTILVRYLHLQVPVSLAFVPARPGFEWRDVPRQNYIDDHIFSKLRTLRMQPSALSRDSTFVRRAYLDTLGVLPTAAEARAFVADERPEKRSRLIDELLERPEFIDFWALKWSDLLHNEEKVLDVKGVQIFHHWIRRSLARKKPLDRFVRELIAARGSTYSEPPANFYRALRDPLSRAESVAQLFLGTRLQCAKCHNHPFDRWTQDDYYDWAAFFARVRYKVLENRRRDNNDKHEFHGEQIVWMARQGEVEDPRTGRAARPRFLGRDAHGPDGDVDRLEALADWVTSPENPFFARSLANRIWFHLMGRGIVEPVDDFRATNPPSHPELLDALADDLVAHGFDLAHLIRVIMNSRAYQLSARPNDSNRDDATNFARATIRRLSAEQILDAQCQVTDVPLKFNGYPLGLRAAQLPGVRAVRLRDRRPTPGDQFLQLFGKPPRLLACECERSSETTMGQAFQLISGPTINQLLSHPDNRLGRLLASGRSFAEIIEEFYWSALGRGATPLELETTVSFLENSTERRSALEDIVWGLLNAKEFVLRR